MADHVRLWWEAEEENSSRVAAPANLVLSGILAALGVKLFIAGDELRAVLGAPWLVCGFFIVATSAAAALIVFALASVLEVKLRRAVGWKRRPPASANLNIDQQLARAPWKMTESQARWFTFRKAYNAASELQVRNIERINALYRAQVAFFISVLCLFASLVAYTIAEWDGGNDAGAGITTERESGLPPTEP